jgi:hypothetical protein
MFGSSHYISELFFQCDSPQAVPVPRENTTYGNFTYFFAVEIREGLLSTIVKVTPTSMLSALAKIGGYFSLFRAVRFLLSYIHS